ncbi:MAG: hypothetical protein JNJ65_04030 [Cyclobacteriaceae bacterium]|nr:hypothetical protein [Cyclobacteriaceae bacterium]
MMLRSYLIYLLMFGSVLSWGQNTNPLATEIYTEDLDRFWIALDKAGPEVNASLLDAEYLNPGSRGLQGFTKGRIQNADNLAKTIRAHYQYYTSIKPSLDRIAGMKDTIRQSLVRLKALYPKAVYPPVYFVVGALNSGGTTSGNALIIGAEMYGRTEQTPTQELDDWLLNVIKPVEEVTHIVAHELIHFQQKYDGGNLLAACIKEGAADFLAESISGRHINQHVHDYANPREAELWSEFKQRMHSKDYSGWLYSSTPGRPNDLGYWMGYKITKAYFDKQVNKQEAVYNIFHIRNFDTFLVESGYGK